MSVTTYLHKAKSLADELAATGRAMSIAEFNVIIYCNIGSEYHPLISALNLQPELMSFQDLHSLLMAHEVLLQSFIEPPQAHIAYRPSSNFTGQQQQSSSRSPASFFNPSRRSSITYQNMRLSQQHRRQVQAMLPATTPIHQFYSSSKYCVAFKSKLWCISASFPIGSEHNSTTVHRMDTRHKCKSSYDSKFISHLWYSTLSGIGSNSGRKRSRIANC